jgi:hypothetical protein
MAMALRPRRRRRPPSYRRHATGQAFVTLNGRSFYPGVHGTAESHEAYDRAIAEWLANGRHLLPQVKWVDYPDTVRYGPNLGSPACSEHFMR